MTVWCSLYLPYAGDTAEPLRAALDALGYQFYDPFGLTPGSAYAQTVKLFIAPAQRDSRSEWTRILGEPDAALLPPLSMIAPCLLVTLDGDSAYIRTHADGAEVSPVDALAPYATEHDCVRRSLLGSALDGEYQAPTQAVGGIALDALPGDVQALAQGVDMKQAGKLFDRMSAGLAAKAGGDTPSARDLLRQPDWNSAGGERIAALLACLNIPNWREPDFVTVRDAYALHERKRRRPNAMLYPGDAETMAAVPDALAYTPIYAGKNP